MNQKFMRGLLSASLIACFLLSMAGCGKGGDVSSKGSDEMSSNILAGQYISKPNTTIEPVRKLSEIYDLLSTDKLSCDSYDLEKYTTPYWEGNIVYNESLNFIKDPQTGKATAQLLYPAAEILSIKNSKLDNLYEEGVDYVCSGNVITLTENSRIHCYKYNDIYFNDGNANNRWKLKSDFDYQYTWFSEGTTLHESQVAVTYLHTEPWKGFKPGYEGQNISNVISKLKEGKDVTIVFYGDSITAGYNASGMFGIAPRMPLWTDLVVDRLKKAYPQAKITAYNTAVGGTTSIQGLQNCKASVTEKKPDLVIMGYGMNDGTSSVLTPKVYQSNIINIISNVKESYSASTDFILIATILPNPEVKLGDAYYMEEYEPKLYELEKKGTEEDGGIIIASMTQMHRELLSRKGFFAMTGNNVNHPNDFLARAYAQYILTLLVENY